MEDYRHIAIRAIYENYENNYYKNLFEWISEKKHGLVEVFIDYKKLINGPEDIFRICCNLYEQPSDIILATSLALEKVRTFILKKPRRKIIARFYNFDPLTPINDIKTSMIQRFISVKGIVLRTCPIKLLTTSMDFSCLECHAVISRRFPDGIYVQPTVCTNSACKSKYFVAEKNTAKTILYQRIRIQEVNEDTDFVNSGRIPKTIECELKENLVNTVISGDILIVNGILKTERAEDAENRSFNGGKNKVQGLFVSYIDVNSIINTKTNKKQLSANEDEFTENDLKMIEALANTPNIFHLLVKSFCPAIYGHELVKAGIILAITGGSNLEEVKAGTQKSKSNKIRTSLRPDCHVLLIGDPGLGKSQLLKYAVNIAPRGVYICGNATTNAGLTVAVQKDANGEGSLEAGALVLSDQGVCCIDEFDKMSSEHLSLLEAMEQQTVSIAKSGVLCSLSTRTTIIASANPIGGNYK